MLRRVASSFGMLCALGLALASLAACGTLFETQEREPWRAQAEAACLSSGQVHQTAGITVTEAIEGPGVCGIDHPFRVASLEGLMPSGAMLTAMRNTRPLESTAAMPLPAPEPFSNAPGDASGAGASPPLQLSGAGGVDPVQEGGLPPAPPLPMPDAMPSDAMPSDAMPPGGYTPVGNLPDLDAPRPPAPLPLQPANQNYPSQAQPLPTVQLQDNAPFAVSLDRSVVLSCGMIPALTQWLNQVVQPAAMANFGSPVVELTSFGSYSCRRMDNRSTGHMSEHAYANAIDVNGFKLANGRTVKVLSGWRGAADEQSFWRDAAYGACQDFSTVLGPGASDGLHQNHLHLDMARHNRSAHICRPRVPAGWVPTALRGAAPMAANQPEPQFTGSIEEPTKGEDDD